MKFLFFLLSVQKSSLFQKLKKWFPFSRSFANPWRRGFRKNVTVFCLKREIFRKNEYSWAERAESQWSASRALLCSPFFKKSNSGTPFLWWSGARKGLQRQKLAINEAQRGSSLFFKADKTKNSQGEKIPFFYEWWELSISTLGLSLLIPFFFWKFWKLKDSEGFSLFLIKFDFPVTRCSGSVILN